MANSKKLPNNSSLLTSLQFVFQIQRLEGVNYHLQSADLPGISLEQIEISTPHSIIREHGTNVLFEELTVSFLVDEDLQNYLEIYNWILGLGSPNEYGEYRAFEQASFNRNVKSDATLTLLTGASNPNLEVKFTNMFPLTLSSISFSTTEDASNPITADVTFAYDRSSIRKL